MPNFDVSILLALASNLIFTASSLGYRHVSRKATPLWMNTVKTLVAAACFVVVTLVTTGTGVLDRSGLTLAALLLSGFVGLAIGDTFLLSAISVMGSARALILFSFHPIWTGSFAYLFLGQSLRWNQMLAVLCLMGCLYALASERDADGNRAWSLKALGMGLLAVTLDATGVLLTRYAFDLNSDMGVFEANAVRCVGAVLGFIVLAPWVKSHLRRGWQGLEPRDRKIALIVSLSGTFLSLSLWLAALRIGTLAVLSAIAGAGPLFATLMESILDRRKPAPALWLALAFFAIGFGLLQL